MEEVEAGGRVVGGIGSRRKGRGRNWKQEEGKVRVWERRKKSTVKNLSYKTEGISIFFLTVEFLFTQ